MRRQFQLRCHRWTKKSTWRYHLPARKLCSISAGEQVVQKGFQTGKAQRPGRLEWVDKAGTAWSLTFLWREEWSGGLELEMEEGNLD